MLVEHHDKLGPPVTDDESHHTQVLGAGPRQRGQVSGLLDVGCDRGVAGQHGPLAAGVDVQGPGAGQLGEAQAGP